MRTTQRAYYLRTTLLTTVYSPKIFPPMTGAPAPYESTPQSAVPGLYTQVHSHPTPYASSTDPFPRPPPPHLLPNASSPAPAPPPSSPAPNPDLFWAGIRNASPLHPGSHASPPSPHSGELAEGSRSHRRSPARRYVPLLPPALLSSCNPPTTMSLAAALHMSYTVNAATLAAVNASISTPVLPSVTARARTATERLAGSSRSCTSTCSVFVWGRVGEVKEMTPDEQIL